MQHPGHDFRRWHTRHLVSFATLSGFGSGCMHHESCTIAPPEDLRASCRLHIQISQKASGETATVFLIPLISARRMLRLCSELFCLLRIPYSKVHCYFFTATITPLAHACFVRI